MVLDVMRWFLTTLVMRTTSSLTKDNVKCNLLVIAHRGASGYVPEHTLGSYALAVTMGADYIETDLVMTKDMIPVCIHDNELSSTTDIRDHPEFKSLFKTKIVDGQKKSGWFTEDFTLEELKTLRLKERIPEIRPGNARMDGAFTIPTFQELIDLVKGMQYMNRIIGIYLEIKHSTYFQKLCLEMEPIVTGILRKNGYWGRQSPIYIQSLEINNLKKLRGMTKLRLVQLFDVKDSQPYDQVVAGTNITYGDMSTPKGLKEVAEYAHAVGPDKTYIIPLDASNRLGEATSFVDDAHTAGLKVHPYTFRAENSFLPAEYKKGTLASQIGNLTGEIEAYVDAGIDGLFCDEPNVPLRIRNNCT